ncbi:GDP-L-galactose phosphorylase 1-like isoform X2 [Durio zibethinus]|uniref:GDP-L-galactose phosphorylase 1-like isoform X2 n=1 Tax=Durio zibethinus TaxID=66656 RepID=A0A6P5X5X9_DURZI|nr:GDP-L-galactose phosphorylase 1-like isoform X2 [Durio zibethinus]
MVVVVPYLHPVGIPLILLSSLVVAADSTICKVVSGATVFYCCCRILFVRMVTVKWLEDNCFLVKNEKSEQLKHSHFFLQGMNFPIYCCGSQSLEEDTSFEGLSCIAEEEQSMLDAFLLSQWEDRMWKGCFRYDVTTSEIKVIAGKMKFFSQLNEAQITDHLAKSEGTLPAWDHFVFDGMKHPEELLFCLAGSKKAKSELIHVASVPDSAILVIINVTPVEYGHVYLVPCTSNRRYQHLDARTVEMVTRIAAEINNHSFRVFYNCYRPNCSDVYFQACYFSDPLPVEFRPVDTLLSGGRRGIHICSVIDYPIKTISFQTTRNLKIMAVAISEICSHLEEKNVQYNLMISDSGKKIFLFLQPFAASHAISAWECGGYFLFKNRYEFDEVTEDAMLKRLSCFSLNDNDFEAVKQLCCSIASKFDI